MKTIPGYEGYQISTDGRHILLTASGRFIAQQKTRKGYMRVKIRNADGSKAFMVHRLVCLTYLPNPDSYSQVNHKNGIKDDNRLENLEWCSGSMNQQHAYDMGLKVQQVGEDHGRAKLTWASVATIRELYKSGEHTFNSLAAQFGVCKSNIEYIVKNRTWVS